MNVVNELLKALNENIVLSEDEWTKENCVVSGNKKWIANIVPFDLLKRSIKDTVNSLMTLNEAGVFFDKFPDTVETPKYGDNWGRIANYIELNNRSIAEMVDNKCKNGILSSIKMLPAIPPSAKSWANCVILSQIFPNIYGDGFNKPVSEENSVYGIKLNCGYSQNIVDFDISDKISPEKQFQAFNNLANLHGLKTGFRIVISEDQLKISHCGSGEENFRWNNPEHQEIFINECVKLMSLGFEAIFIDSAKHIGGYDMDNYTGVGALPDYTQMQYILHQIRERSGKTTISFVGERITDDLDYFKNLGFTSGTTSDANNYHEVKEKAIAYKYEKEFAPGVEVSNDNDEGGRTYEERLNRINTSLFGYEFPSDKLASFMQTEDLFPLRYDANTHLLMMSNPSYSFDGTAFSHWENLFAKDDGRKYNAQVSELFVHSLNL